MKKLFAILTILTFFAVCLEESAFARAGGGRSGGFGGRSSSFGSRGSRTDKALAKPAPSQNQYQKHNFSSLSGLLYFPNSVPSIIVSPPFVP